MDLYRLSSLDEALVSGDEQDGVAGIRAVEHREHRFPDHHVPETEALLLPLLFGFEEWTSTSQIADVGADGSIDRTFTTSEVCRAAERTRFISTFPDTLRR